jgi:methenyltetrahydromethanopterin cyclohydrolase
MSDATTQQLNTAALAVLKAAFDGNPLADIARSTVGGATVIDCGVETPGSDAAGVLMARVAMAGLGEVRLEPAGSPRMFPRPCGDQQPDAADVWKRPVVSVTSRSPIAACLASQYAGWKVSVGGFHAMASGPIRAAIGKEPLFDRIGMREQPPAVIGLLEAASLPTADVVASLAEAAGVSPQQMTLLVAPTASSAGTLQVVARSLETALHKLETLGFDLSLVVAGQGRAPLPPVADDDLTAIGRTNDAVLYGSHVVLEVNADEPLLDAVGAAMTSSASPDHGKGFATLFEAAGGDFYAIDPAIFAPAVVDLFNPHTGDCLRFGQLEVGLVRKSFGLEPAEA